MSGWNAYITNLLASSSSIRRAAIVGTDGSVWAQSEGDHAFKVMGFFFCHLKAQGLLLEFSSLKNEKFFMVGKGMKQKMGTVWGDFAPSRSCLFGIFFLFLFSFSKNDRSRQMDSFG